MSKFKLGETVQLRSGGPVMTVINVIDNENPGQWKLCTIKWKAENPSAKVWYQTQWFEGSELKKDFFIEEALSSAEIDVYP